MDSLEILIILIIFGPIIGLVLRVVFYIGRGILAFIFGMIDGYKEGQLEGERMQPTEQPKKGIGTDPNSPNLCLEDFRNWGHWEKEAEEEKNKKKKHFWTREW